jgi:hypothetical protein
MLAENVLVLAAEGPVLGSGASATDIIGETFTSPIDTVVVPVERLDPDFFALSTGVAGEFVQKFVNYRRRLVILGDITAHLEASGSLRDWVREANRGPDVWFVTDVQELERRLS